MYNNSIWKKVICLALSLCFCAGLLLGDCSFNHLAYAEDVLTMPQPENDSADEDGWLYRICDDGHVEVLGYTDNTVSVLTMPTSLGGAWVVRVAQDAFADNVALETISIPATVAEINASAFPNHTNLTVHAANGTIALNFAAQRNFDAVNTSEYDFFDDILDLSEMKASQFSVVGNTVTIAEPYSLQVKAGMKAFLPANGKYTQGLPVTILSLSISDTSVLVNFSHLDFMDTVENYSVENLPLSVDPSGVVILADGFSLIQSTPRGTVDTTLSPSLTFAVNHELADGLKIKGALTYSPQYTLSMDYSWFKLSSFSYTNTTTTKFDLETDLSLEFNDEGNSKTKKWSGSQAIRFARVPLSTPALVSVWLDVSLVVSLDGKISFETSVTTTESFAWETGGEIKTTKSKKTNLFRVNSAIEFGVEVKNEFVVNVGFSGTSFNMDIAELSVSVGISVGVSGNSDKPYCLDVELAAKLEVGIQLGILNVEDSKSNIALSSKPISMKWSIGKQHVEIDSRGVTFPAKCTYAKECLVSFSTGTNTVYTPFYVPEGDMIPQVPAPTRVGYTFTGWYVDSDFTMPWWFDVDTVQDDMTLYAGWVQGESDGTVTPEQSSMTYLRYEIVDGEAHITGYSGAPVKLVIPENIEGCPVTIIKSRAFWECSTLQYVRLPQTITEIGSWAFLRCNALTSINLPESLLYLGTEAFRECTELCKVMLPNELENIGGGAFSYCSKLEQVDIPEGITCIGDSMFTGCALYEVDLPESIALIGHQAFVGCKNLKEVVIPSSVKTIGSFAFANCTSLMTIKLNEGLESIGPGAFVNVGASKLMLPKSVRHIGDQAFGSTFTSINIPPYWASVLSFVPTNPWREIQSPFMTSRITHIVISEETVAIPQNAFDSCSNLISVSIPDGVETISREAFAYCDNLTSIAIPNSVKNIAYDAFTDCNSLRYVHVNSMDSYATTWFQRNFPSVEICVVDETLATVHFNTNGGSSIDTVYVNPGSLLAKPNTPTRQDYAFTGWYKDAACLTPWNFSSDMVSDNDMTLYAGWKHSPATYRYENGIITAYVGNSTSITLPSSINGEAITGISADAIPATVRSVTIPVTMVDIEPGAFRKAEKLTQIMVEANHPLFFSYGGTLISNEGVLIAYPRGNTSSSYTMSTNVKQIAPFAIYMCNNLTSISIGSNVVQIDSHAISNCANLTNIHFSLHEKTVMLSDFAITNCSQLRSIYASNSDVRPTGTHNFTGCSSNLSIYGTKDHPALRSYADTYGYRYNMYTVTFMEGDNMLGTLDVRVGQLIGMPPAPPDEAMTFHGWSSTADGGNLWDFSADVMPQNALTLYVVWRYDFTTEAVEGGVKLTGYTGSKTNVHVPESIDGKAVVAIAEGVFPDTSVTLIGNKGSVTEVYALAHGMSFTPLMYTVTFVGNGGTHVEAQKLAATQAVVEPDIIRTGYTLVGWYTDSVLSNGWNFDVNVMPAADLTLYAYWEKNDETVVDIPFAFETTVDGLVITGYTGSRGAAVIPETVNGIPVVAIADYAFYRNDTLLQVTIPANVKSIGDAAFAQSHIGSVILEAGVTYIGEYAFADCVELSNISFTDSVTSVGQAAFQNCTALTSVALPKNLTCIGENAFSGCTFLNSVELPTNLETIASAAFAECTHLKSVRLGAAVSDVAVDAFSGCTGLSTLAVSEGNLYYSSADGILFSKDGSQLLLYPQGKEAQSYTVPETVTAIGAEAMSGSRITTLILNDKLASIGTSALQSSMHLENITFAANSNLAVIGDSAFSGCISLTKVSFPESLTYIGAYAFSSCNLTTVELPAEVEIGNQAFKTSDSLTIYGDASSAAAVYAQENDIRFVDPSVNVEVTNISLPETLTMNVGDAQLLIATLTPDNTTETAITWNSSDSSVVFVDVNGLLSARYVGTATIMATAANGSTDSCTVTVQRGGDLPEQVVLSDTELSLAAGMLYPLSATVLPEGCVEANITWTTSDGRVALYVNGCVTTLAEGSAMLTASTANGITATCTVTVYPAFGQPDMTLPASLMTIEDEAFYGLPVSVISCPDGLKSIGAMAFANCSSLRQIWIPDSVISIDSSAFDGCTELLIYGEAGSAAEDFAKNNGFTFVVR